MLSTVSWTDLDLLPHHVTVLTDRGITPDVAHAHGYRSSTGEGDLRALGYRGAAAEVTGALVIPLHDADGEVCGYQIRPDDELPGDRPGSVLKYLTPPRQSNVIDIPIRLGAAGDNLVSDPNTPIVVTEGPLKAAAASSRGIPCVSIQGVSCYVGTTSQGGKGAYLPDWRQFVSNRHWIVGYDSDAMQKPEVLREAHRLGSWLARKKGARVSYLMLPGAAEKTGLDDWLTQNPDASFSDLRSLLTDELPDPNEVDQSDPDAVRATDLDVSDCYVTRYGDQVRYLTDLGKWVGYAGGSWDLSGGESVARANAQELFRGITAYHEKPQPDGSVKRLDASPWLYSAERLTNCLSQVRANRYVQARADDLNRSPMLLNVANGTVDLVSGMLHPHDPRDLLTQRTDVQYDTDAMAPEFERFVSQVLPDNDVRGFVQRLFGMSLLGEVRDHVFTVFTGTGRNGKGVLLRIAQAVFGDYSTGIHKDLLIKTNFEGHPTHLASLYGRRLAVAQELERGAKWDVARVKELTGGDSVTARWMRGNEFTFTPSHTIVMSSNHRPAVGEGERAFWTRYREVPFTVSFEGREDVTLADRIIDRELPGVLQWMLRGLREYLDHGLGSPDAVTAATREAQEESDPLLRFVHERLEVTGSPNDVIPTREVYDAWQSWCATEGDHIKVGSYLRFGRTLTGATSALTSAQGRHGELSKVSLIVGATWVTETPESAEVETPTAEVGAEVELDHADTVSAGQSVTADLEEVEEVNPEIHHRVGEKKVSMCSTSSAHNSRVTSATSTHDPLPTSDGVTESEVRGSTVSTVTTGLLSDGTVNPEYRITAAGERGVEVVSYPEWVRRMKVAGKWVEPEVGFTWYPLDGDGVSDAA